MPVKSFFKSAAVIFVLSVLAFGFIAPAFAAEYTVFGPKSYTRSSGSPVTVTDNFSATAGSYVLRVYNGGLQDAPTELVSATEIYLNNVKVVAPNELNQNTPYLEKQVTLTASNTLKVEVRGKPGGSLVVKIVGVSAAPVLSVSVSPDSWPIGAIDPGTTIVMSDSQKITVTNDGNANENYSLKLVNPAGWQDSQTAVDSNTYILNAAFSSNPANIGWNESNHALSETDTLCSSAKFAGDQTGVNVAASAGRTLWFQFKAPASTKVTSQQTIEVIVTAQLP